MQSPSTRAGMVLVLEQQVVCQTWIWMDIMPCISKPSRSSSPPLKHYRHVLPLAAADKAHAQMEASDHAGKRILRVA